LTFDAFEDIQLFGIGQGAMGCGKVKPIRSGGTVTVVLADWNVVIDGGNFGYQIQ